MRTLRRLPRPQSLTPLLLLLQLVLLARAHAQVTPHPPAILGQRPVAYWRFGDARTTNVALDSTGHGYNGVYFNAVTRGLTGVASDNHPSISVNGVDGYVAVSEVPIKRSFTALIWARSKTPQWNTHGWVWNARTSNGFIIHPDAGTNIMALYVYNSAQTATRIGEIRVPDITQWHQYGVMYDEVKQTASVVFDGRIVSSVSYPATSRAVTANIGAWFGRDACCGLRYGNGGLDEAVLFDRALTQNELTAQLVFGRITGQVRDRNFNPIAGAMVSAGNGRFAFTNASGQYDLPNMPLGTFTLRASLNGWTFGSFAFQNNNYTVPLTLSQPNRTVNITGWRFDPIVFVHGWTSNPNDFAQLPAQFRNAGYYTIAGQLQTSVAYTPLFAVNATRVKEWIDTAKYDTGRSKVILYAQSMGGLVARSYLEGFRYDGDVSQLFTYGSPHLGTPNIYAAGCFALPRPDAICQMTQPGMALFNLTHPQRWGVDYHLVAGDAPMWGTRRVCTRILWWTVCVNIPWPDTTFRNTGGWALGAVISGKDDAFIQTRSASGMPGIFIDRFLTREVHTTGLGPRDYHEWNGTPSGEGFAQCSRRVLIDRTINTCGTRIWPGPPPYSFLVPGLRTLERTWSPESAAPALEQQTRVDPSLVAPGETQVREVLVEGGPTAFTASWSEGTVAVSLIDPSGKTIDPEYVASIQGSPDDPDVRDQEEPHPDTVTYAADASRAAYYFPAAQPGTWRVVLQGGDDLSEKGTSVTTVASTDSTLTASFEQERLWYAPGAKAAVRLVLSEPVMSAEAWVTVRLPGGETQELRLERTGEDEYTGGYGVPQRPGYAVFDWSLTGQRADGTPFERGGREYFQIQSTALHLGDGHADQAIPREDAEGLNAALAVTLQVRSEYEGGDLEVSADLVAEDGTTVAHVVAQAPAKLGDNGVELRFRAEDIYRSQKDGPYTVRNVKLLDARDAPLLASEADSVHQTAAYSYLSFAPAHGTPSVFLQGPFQATSDEVLTLTATGIDPEGDDLSFAWDLDDDGTFETQGASVKFAARGTEEDRLQPIHVQVTDAEGNSATASTSVQVSAAR